MTCDVCAEQRSAELFRLPPEATRLPVYALLCLSCAMTCPRHSSSPGVPRRHVARAPQGSSASARYESQSRRDPVTRGELTGATVLVLDDVPYIQRPGHITSSLDSTLLRVERMEWLALSYDSTMPLRPLEIGLNVPLAHRSPPCRRARYTPLPPIDTSAPPVRARHRQGHTGKTPDIAGFPATIGGLHRAVAAGLN